MLPIHILGLVVHILDPVMDTQNMQNKTKDLCGQEQDVSEQHQTHVVQAKGQSGKRKGGKTFILPAGDKDMSLI